MLNTNYEFCIAKFDVGEKQFPVWKLRCFEVCLPISILISNLQFEAFHTYFIINKAQVSLSILYCNMNGVANIKQTHSVNNVNDLKGFSGHNEMQNML